MAKPNYSFAKRQREIAKKEKKEAKRKQKAEAQQSPEGVDQEEVAQEGIQDPDASSSDTPNT